MDVVISVVERIAHYLLHAALRQLGYLLHYNHNIRTLRKQAKKLAETRERVQEKIDSAKRNGEIIKTEVQKWIAGVDNIIAEAEKFLDDEVDANMRCLKGWCINFCSLYRFSKEALKMAKKIFQLLEEGKFESVSYPAPPPEITSSSERVSDTLESTQIDHEANYGDHNGEGNHDQTVDIFQVSEWKTLDTKVSSPPSPSLEETEQQHSGNYSGSRETSSEATEEGISKNEFTGEGSLMCWHDLRDVSTTYVDRMAWIQDSRRLKP